ncbi:MAG: thioesterase domain-containing protein [Pseudomonadota bacterium]
MAEFNAVRAAIIAELNKFDGVGGLDHATKADVLFDDLEGFTSLKAVELCMAMEERFGIEVDMAEITEVDGVHAFARRVVHLIGGDKADTPAEVAGAERLVALNKGKEGVCPVFLVHPGGGGVFPYRALVNLMPPDVPVFGIQARMPNHPDGSFSSINEMAEAYKALIAPVIGHHRLKVGGWSGGGLVALQMAALQSHGEPAKLVLIETFNPQHDGRQQTAFERLTTPAYWTLANWQRHQFRAKIKKMPDMHAALPEEDVEERFQKPVLDAFSAARARYQPRVANADLFVVRAKAGRWNAFRAGPAMGWDLFVSGDVETLEVLASHQSIILPAQIAQWAPAVSAFLSD